MKSTLAMALLASVAWPCYAAQIDVNQSTITIDGDIDFGDFVAIQSKTSILNNATVVLKSNGGKLLPAIKIGELIKTKGYATYVQEYCASACTLIWLAGQQRYMTPTALIGLHAAYDAGSGMVNGMANALVGAYLNKIGLPYEAVMYATSAGPDSMKWLTVTDANKHGIDVSVINTQTQPTLEQQALQVVGIYFANWSFNSSPQALANMYWDSATYYGKMTSKRDILMDKQKFIEQWPVRTYKIRSGTTAVKCNRQPVTECSVTGVVDWEASNQTKRSIGAASFDYVLRPWPLGSRALNDNESIELRISLENVKVLQRQITERCDNANGKYSSICPSP
jgi:ATP-dependent protease ClpP protease subunit